MRRFACALGVLLAGAVAGSCSGAPMTLTGSISYSWGCEFEMGPTPETTHPACPGGTQVYSGANQEGNPPLIVGCTVTPRSDGSTALRFRIARGGPTLDTSEGVVVSGIVAGPGQEMTQTAVDLYLRGSQAINQSAPGTCHVRINTLEGVNFSGQLQCRDAHDNQVPYRKIRIAGISGSAGTADPEWADFSFSNCGMGP